MLRLRKYIALVSLLVFLFPQAINLAHELDHVNDTHCQEKTVRHFHNEEHHCNICDFVPFASGDVSLNDIPSFSHSTSSVGYTAAGIEHTASADTYLVLLRGPPTA